MTKYQIEALLPHLPRKNAFITPQENAGLKDRMMYEAQLRSRCLNSPAFGWKFVRSLESCRFRAPKVSLPPVLLRALDHCKGIRDASIDEAISVTLPDSSLTAWILEALLLCVEPYAPDPQGAATSSYDAFEPSVPTSVGKAVFYRPLSFEKISELTGLSASAVSDYEQLFFNVRDRGSDRAYVAGLVFPQTRLAKLNGSAKEPTSIAQRLKMAAFNRGADDVIAIAGLRRNEDVAPTTTMNRLQNAILQHAVLALENGDHDSKLISEAIKLAAEHKIGETPDSVAGLTAVSMYYETTEMFRKMQESDIKLRLAEQAAALEGQAGATKDPDGRSSDASAIHHYTEEEKGTQ